MRTLINIILIIILFSLFFLTQLNLIVLAAQDTITIDVNVSVVSQIILVPESLTWLQVGTGSAGGYKNITLKNAGSLNVSEIYSYVDTLTDEAIIPYGSDDPASYAAGGVLTIKNETDSRYYFLGRLEWNWTQDIPTSDFAAVTSPIAWGYFRNTSNDYVWVVGNGTNGFCNNTGTKFAIEDDIDLGTLETRTPSDTTITRNAGDASYSYFSVSRDTAPLYRFCVATYYDCTKIYIYNFDKRSGFTNCAESDYLQEGQLAPGNTIILKVDPWVPNGIPGGNLTQATLTVVAS
jgi:hypothetical protein